MRKKHKRLRLSIETVRTLTGIHGGRFTVGDTDNGCVSDYCGSGTVSCYCPSRTDCASDCYTFCNGCTGVG